VHLQGVYDKVLLDELKNDCSELYIRKMRIQDEEIRSELLQFLKEKGHHLLYVKYAPTCQMAVEYLASAFPGTLMTQQLQQTHEIFLLACNRILEEVVDASPSVAALAADSGPGFKPLRWVADTAEKRLAALLHGLIDGLLRICVDCTLPSTRINMTAKDYEIWFELASRTFRRATMTPSVRAEHFEQWESVYVHATQAHRDRNIFLSLLRTRLSEVLKNRRDLLGLLPAMDYLICLFDVPGPGDEPMKVAVDILRLLQRIRTQEIAIPK
jgi:hypothetical protein